MYFMLDQKHFPIEEYKNATQKMNMSICIQKMVVITKEHSIMVRIFINGKLIHDRQ